LCESLFMSMIPAPGHLRLGEVAHELEADGCRVQRARAVGQRVSDLDAPGPLRQRPDAAGVAERGTLSRASELYAARGAEGTAAPRAGGARGADQRGDWWAWAVHALPPEPAKGRTTVRGYATGKGEPRCTKGRTTVRPNREGTDTSSSRGWGGTQRAAHLSTLRPVVSGAAGLPPDGQLLPGRGAVPNSRGRRGGRGPQALREARRTSRCPVHAHADPALARARTTADGRA
jgi:hypothetical protein